VQIDSSICGEDGIYVQDVPYAGFAEAKTGDEAIEQKVHFESALTK